MTTKAPLWSTNAILLQVGAHNSMVMHLLLSSMFSEMTHDHPKANLFLRAAQQHYRAGVSMLVEVMSGTQEPDHIAVMAAFWFLYVCSRRRKEMTFQMMAQLSMAVKNHIEMFNLHNLIAAPRSSDRDALSKAGASTTLSPKQQSLLARLIIWTYYLDVQYSFRGCQGAFARFLQTNSSSADEIYDRSRSVLELNWGAAYPPSEAVDDMENSATLELLYKLWKLVQRVNDASQAFEPIATWGPEIEQQLSNIETEYSTVFRLANTPIIPRNRLLCNIDWVVAHFYALRIYHFHCTCAPADKSPKIVKDALASLLSVVQRTLCHGVTDQTDRLQWALFLAGIETEDAIHREWILSKMLVRGQLRETLLAILSEREKNGGTRVSAHVMREMMYNSSMAALGGLGGDEGGEAQIACMF
jgi:hypothetical protein